MNKSLNKSTADAFSDLVEVVSKLRGPNGCPWDKEQNQKSLVKFILEEAFEVAEAIESESQQEICEELGDYLFQVILQAEIAQELGEFTLKDIIESITNKMIRRHPHVFSDTQVADSDEVKKNWELIKAEEKALKEKKSQTNKTIFNYPKNLPSLMAASKIGHKTAGYAFDWSNPQQVLCKVNEEIEELTEALQQKNISHIQHEIGDVLFSVAQLARHLNLDPEHSLRQANRRFQNRFEHVLQSAKTNLDIHSKEQFAKLADEIKEKLWNEAKIELQKNENT